MAISRYRNTGIVNSKHYSTVDLPDIDLTKIPTFNVRLSNADRLDVVAFKYLGAGEYWWVLAFINDLDWFVGFEDGQIIKIPVNVDDVLRFF
jgi:hypothetical protein